MDMKVWVNCYNEGLYDQRCLLNHLITRQKVTDDIIDSAITSKLLYLVKYEMKTNCVSDYIAYRKVKGTRLYKNLKNKKTKLYLKSVSFVIDLYNREMKSKREKMVLDLQLVLIQEMAKTWNKSYVEISDYLKKYDLLSYIDVCFEKYNSTGIQGILDDLQEYIEEQGGQVINGTCFNSIAVIKKIEKENEILIEYVQEDINLARAIARKRNKIIYNEDTLSCAYEGLVKAANTYKSNKGCKFSSYAYRLINNSIREGLNRSILDLGNSHIWRVTRVGDRPELKSQITESKFFKSIPVNDNMIDEISNKQNRDLILRYLNRLPIEERQVLEMRYGLNDTWRVYTRKEVASKLNMSISTVERRERKGIEKLRSWMKLEGVLDVYA